MNYQYPKQNLSVGLCQMSSSDSPNENLEQILSLLEELNGDKNLDVICFPENSLFLKISRSDELKSFDLSEEIFKELKAHCKEHKREILLGSLPYKENGYVSNATVHLTSLGQAHVVYRKIHLFDVDVEGETPVRESDQFRHGQKPVMLDIKGWKWGLSICYDLRFSELYHFYALQGAHVLFVPSAFLVPTGQAHWHTLLKARAIESQAFVVAPAQGGVHKSSSGGHRHTFGHSLVVSPWGDLIGEIKAPGPGFRVLELEVKELARVHRQIPMAHHRRLGTLPGGQE